MLNNLPFETPNCYRILCMDVLSEHQSGVAVSGNHCLVGRHIGHFKQCLNVDSSRAGSKITVGTTGLQFVLP